MHLSGNVRVVGSLRKSSPGQWACVAVLGFALAAPAVGQQQAAPPAAQPPAAAPQSQPANGPKVRCDEPVHDFGPVWAGDKLEHAFVLHNDGNAPLEITNVRPACGCTVAGAYDKTIPPGKEGKIPFTLATTRSPSQLPLVKPITVETNDPVTPRLTLTIKGVARTRMAIEPVAGANFGRVKPPAIKPITLKITNNTPGTMKLEPVADPEQKVFQAQIKELEPGKVAEVTISLVQAVPEGSHSRPLKFHTGLTDEPELAIPCNATNPPLVEIMPVSIAGVPVAQETIRMHMITYNGEGSLNIASLVPSDPGIKAQLIARDAGRAYTLSVTLPANFQSPVGQPEKLVLTTSLEKAPTVEIPIDIRPAPVATQPGVMAESLIGKPGPVGVLKAPDGSEVRVGGPSDQVTVLNFWATWCPHCKRQLPMLQAVRSAFAGKAVRFLNVSVDSQRSPQEVAETAKSLGTDIPIALDPSNLVSARYGGGNSLPTLFVLDRSGAVAAVHRGDKPELNADLPVELNLLLEGKGRADFPERLRLLPGQVTTRPATVLAVGPSLSVEPLRQEIGAKRPSEMVHYVVNCRNGGAQPLKIKAGTTSEGLRLDPGYLKTVPSGATATLNLEFNVPTKPGPFEHQLVLESNDPAHATQTVSLTGMARAFIEVQPPAGITFPRNPRTHHVPTMGTLVYNGTGKVEYGKPESSSPKFEATIEPLPNAVYARVVVRAKPPFQPGDNDATIQVKTSCPEQPVVSIPVHLFMPQRVEVMPAEVTLNLADRMQRNTVVITNNGEKSLNILGVKSSNQQIRTQFYPESDGMSYRLILILTGNPTTQPTAERQDTITVRTDDPEFGELTIPVKVTNRPPAPAPLRPPPQAGGTPDAGGAER